MNDLEKLGKKYGTDKIGKHNYLPVYYGLFKDRRNEVKKVLEIGVGEGAGLRMFRDFFPNAMIYGAEIDETRLLKEDRIVAYLCHQGIEKDLIYLIDVIGSDIDLVIDDGSHKPEDQYFTCATVMPMLSKKTIYVIEDVADARIMNDVGISVSNPLIVRLGKRYDDCLIVFKK